MVENVFFALSELNGNKALGSNGFSLAFWQFCWDFVKDEVIVALRRVSSTTQGDCIKEIPFALLICDRDGDLREVKNLEALALEFGCKVRMLQSAYLGLPLGAQHKSVAVCDG
ncbi:hypothetical protein CK203_002353 [Vitis vinifera]|uniref:Uncharacterized protein n=1 Tax=Vitis vinifera TaxID=29760 RepID=A0A438KKC8_VITVI|nr:hypothetical protein CK203_002353 [Vitis vinifera]